MLERLNNAFAAQRQFTGNAAHELRTPLALMQAQLELFSAEHPDVRPETAEFLTLLREQTERLTQMTKTLLEMSNLQQVARNEQTPARPHDRGDLHGSRTAGGEATASRWRRRATAS